jgi:hypothetical protein
MEAVITDGDREFALEDVGESAEDESRLDWSGCEVEEEGSKFLGLSFPVGPLPRTGLFAGGMLRV